MKDSPSFHIVWEWYLLDPIPMPKPWPMRIMVRRCSLEGESTTQQPLFAISDLDLAPSLGTYLSQLQPAIEQWILEQAEQDTVAFLTYTEAMRQRNDSALLTLAVRIHCLSILSEGHGTGWTSQGNRIPIEENVLIDRQLHNAAIKNMETLEKSLVKELSQLIFKPKAKPWYELFLALYVFFSAMGRLHGQVIGRSDESCIVEKQLKWSSACNTLYWHWVVVLRRNSPFHFARSDPEELKRSGQIDDEGIRYMVTIARIFDDVGDLSNSHYWDNLASSGWINFLFKVAGA